VANRPLEDAPGTVFKYGGPGFQVAGAVVEAVTHERWATLFDERIAKPLVLAHTYWKHLPDRGIPADATLNPLLQGGLVTSADDYARFLTMLVQHGRFGTRRVLSEQAVKDMETAQTRGKPKAYLPPNAKSALEYALGNWCERFAPDGQCTLVSSPGAFGTLPWIDRDSGLYGIFFVQTRVPHALAHLEKARAAIIAAGG
jgi:CubicO group peptidase (beta-lactamase class C family)